MTTPIVSSASGTRVAVSDLIQHPRVIPRRMISMMDQQFVVDAILRDGGDAPGGSVQFEDSPPLYADQDAAVKEEFAEYPIATASTGRVRVAIAENRGLGIVVSEDMRRRNRMDRITQQMTVTRNTLVRTWETAFRSAFTSHADVSTFPVSAGAWNTSTAEIRHDIFQAKNVVGTAVAPGTTESYLGFSPDTLIVSADIATAILSNEQFASVYQGDLAAENVQYTGVLPRQIAGLTTLVSRTWPNDTALVLERDTVGFIADERPMQASPLRYNEDTEAWRSNVSRISALGIDQPKAACFITGVSA